MMSTTLDQPRLFDDTPDLESRVRSNDPDSSWAPARITRADNESLKDTLYRILANSTHPLTHDELHSLYTAEGGKRTAQRVRTACAEMARDRNIRTGIEETARIRQAAGIGRSEHGGEATLWEAIR
jgi:hypothetical protein